MSATAAAAQPSLETPSLSPPPPPPTTELSVKLGQTEAGGATLATSVEEGRIRN